MVQAVEFVADRLTARNLLRLGIEITCGPCPPGKGRTMLWAILVLLVMWKPVLLSPGRRRQPTGVA